jgi:hypothetical protein
MTTVNATLSLVFSPNKATRLRSLSGSQILREIGVVYQLEG